jgi:hypothetical protein
MTILCPRCETGAAILAHRGTEAGAVIWQVWHCSACAFTWRDSEPAETVDPQHRPPWAQLRGVDLSGLRQVIPPARKPA